MSRRTHTLCEISVRFGICTPPRLRTCPTRCRRYLEGNTFDMCGGHSSAATVSYTTSTTRPTAYLTSSARTNTAHSPHVRVGVADINGSSITYWVSESPVDTYASCDIANKQHDRLCYLPVTTS